MDPFISNLGQTIIEFLKKHHQLDKLPDLINFLQTQTPQDFPEKIFVITSVPLTSSQKRTLTQILHQQINPKIPIVFQIDPQLIGGLVIKYQDKILDLSIKGRLNKIKQELSYE